MIRLFGTFSWPFAPMLIFSAIVYIICEPGTGIFYQLHRRRTLVQYLSNKQCRLFNGCLMPQKYNNQAP
jgi:hypothetical protein